MAVKTSGRVIGGVIVVVGVLISLVALLPTIMIGWQIWNGSAPDMIMVKGDNGPVLSAWQFLGLCSGVLSTGVVLLGVGLQFLCHSTRQE